MHRLILSLPVLAGCGGLMAAELRWRNGDMMPGDLVEGGGGRIRWSNLHWPEPWTLDAGSLESVGFDKPESAPGGTWRILTYAGDSLVADLEGGDDPHFRVSSPILGEMRIRREAVWEMERMDDPDDHRIFLADSYRDWLESGGGPISGLRYRIHRLGEGWDVEGFVPDYAGMEPIAEGRLPNGRIDFESVSFEGPRAAVYEGEIELRGDAWTLGLFRPSYSGSVLAGVNWARLTVGEHSLSLDRRDPENYDMKIATELTTGIRLMPGRYPLRFEFIGEDADHPIHASLCSGDDAGIESDPRNPYSLMSMGSEPVPGWSAGPDGLLKTTEEQATVFREVRIPESFELEAELSSGSSPRFVLGLGKTIAAARSSDAFRVETWGEALVATRGKSFETLRILEEGEREVRLLLRYHGPDRLLHVFGLNGALLARWEGARIESGHSGICLYNEGNDLTVGRIRLSRLDGGPAVTGFGESRVRLRGGEVLRGRLRRHPTTGAWSVASGEGVRKVELARVDRIVRPPRAKAPAPADVMLVYGRWARIRGLLQEVTPGAMILSTDLSEEPVVCSREGLSSLRFLSPGSRWNATDHILKTGDYSLKGKLELKGGQEPLWWLPEGALRSQPVASRFEGRIERATAGSPSGNLPHLIRLYGNMRLPGRLISLDEEQLVIEAFLLGRRVIASRHLRALELDRDPLLPAFRDRDRRSERSPEALEAIPGIPPPGSRSSGDPPRDGEVLERIGKALLIPRHQRDDPPTHLVVARNGDVQRGNLISIDQDSLRLGSRLRIKTLDRDLVRRVVRIAGTDREPVANRFRILIRNGMLLGGGSVSSNGENLVLESPALGRCEIPPDMIQELILGDFELSRHSDPYRDWVARTPGPGEIDRSASEPVNP